MIHERYSGEEWDDTARRGDEGATLSYLILNTLPLLVDQMEYCSVMPESPALILRNRFQQREQSRDYVRSPPSPELTPRFDPILTAGSHPGTTV